MRATPVRLSSARQLLVASLSVAGPLALPAGILAAQSRPPASANATAASSANDPIGAEGYIVPNETIARLVTAPRETNVSYTIPSPGARKYFVRTVSDGLPSLQLV